MTQADAKRSPIRVVIADDEPLARERLRQLLASHPRFEIVAECADGDEALAAALTEKPEVLFLDISMPGLDGIEVAAELAEGDERAGAPPAVVFVTAHDHFAVRAFEVNATDYLVKPVDRERFDRMIVRLERRLGDGGDDAVDGASMLRRLVAELRVGSGYPPRFVVRGPKGHYFVRTEEIEAARADGNYVALLAAGRTHLVRETMKSFESRVDPARFVRIHRSTIVSIDRITHIEPLGHAEYRVTMQGGARFESSRPYCHVLQALVR